MTQGGGLDRRLMRDVRVPVDQIYVPVKLRTSLKPKTVDEIAQTMLEGKPLQPILVRPDGDRFVLVEGVHRLEACKAVGEPEIVALVVQARRS
jgi:ParB-like chromosome segregation protein Spo0J